MKYMQRPFLILPLAIVLLSSIVLLGQENDQSKLRIGMSAGLSKNLSSEIVPISEYTGFSGDYNKTNYRIGLNMDYSLKGSLTIFSAFNYSNLDFTGTYFCAVCDFAFPPSPEEIEFRFIEIPIGVRYYFFPSKIRLFSEFGLNNIFQLNSLSEESSRNRYVLGYKLGGGLEYSFSEKIALQIGFDYNNSISNLFKDSYFGGSDFKLKSITFGIGLLKRI